MGRKWQNPFAITASNLISWIWILYWQQDKFHYLTLICLSPLSLEL